MSRHGLPYSAAEDATIVREYPRLPKPAIAALLGRTHGSVQARSRRLEQAGRLHPRRRAYGRRWTSREDDLLRAHYGVTPDARIAALLTAAAPNAVGRTVEALRNRAFSLGLRKLDNLLPALTVARLFSVDSHEIPKWVLRGWLRAERAEGTRLGRHRQGIWHVSAASVREHITERPWAYWPDKMLPGHSLTRLAQDVAAREPWLTCEAAGRLLNVHPYYLPLLVRRHGLPHQRRPKRGKGGSRVGVLVFRQDELLAWWAAWQARPDYRRLRRAT